MDRIGVARKRLEDDLPGSPPFGRYLKSKKSVVGARFLDIFLTGGVITSWKLQTCCYVFDFLVATLSTLSSHILDFLVAMLSTL